MRFDKYANSFRSLFACFSEYNDALPPTESIILILFYTLKNDFMNSSLELDVLKATSANFFVNQECVLLSFE